MANHTYVYPYTSQFADWLAGEGYAYPSLRPGNRIPTTGELKAVLGAMPDLEVEYPDKGDRCEIHLRGGERHIGYIEDFDWSNDDSLPNEDRENQSFRIAGSLDLELSILKRLAELCGQLVLYLDSGDPPIVVDQDIDVGKLGGVWTWACSGEDCWNTFCEFSVPEAEYPPAEAIGWSSPVKLYTETQIAEREAAAAALQELAWFKDTPLLYRSANVYCLHLHHTYVTDDDLRHLPKIHGLNVLTVNDKVTDQAMPYIGQVKTLTWLRFTGGRITDGGLAHLSELKALAYLNLGCPLVTGEGLGALAQLPRLSSLHLEDISLSDEGVEHLARFARLDHLALDNTAVSDAGMELLANLTQVENLSILDKEITDERLVHLYGLRRLKSLSLQHTRITEEGLAGLKAALPDTEVWGTPGE